MKEMVPFTQATFVILFKTVKKHSLHNTDHVLTWSPRESTRSACHSNSVTAQANSREKSVTVSTHRNVPCMVCAIYLLIHLDSPLLVQHSCRHENYNTQNNWPLLDADWKMYLFKLHFGCINPDLLSPGNMQYSLIPSFLLGLFVINVTAISLRTLYTSPSILALVHENMFITVLCHTLLGFNINTTLILYWCLSIQY